MRGIRRTIEKNVGVLLEVVEGGRGEDTYLTFIIIVDIMWWRWCNLRLNFFADFL